MTAPPLDLTTERLTALRGLAEEAAYDAPWTYKEGFKTGGARVANTSGFDLPGCFNCGDNDGVYEETTARHITAFDPPTVLALLDRVEAAEAKVAAVREALTEVRDRGNDIAGMENNGSNMSRERAARGDGYLEATRIAFQALDGGA